MWQRVRVEQRFIKNKGDKAYADAPLRGIIYVRVDLGIKR